MQVMNRWDGNWVISVSVLEIWQRLETMIKLWHFPFRSIKPSDQELFWTAVWPFLTKVTQLAV